MNDQEPSMSIVRSCYCEIRERLRRGCVFRLAHAQHPMIPKRLSIGTPHQATAIAAVALAITFLMAFSACGGGSSPEATAEATATLPAPTETAVEVPEPTTESAPEEVQDEEQPSTVETEAVGDEDVDDEPKADVLFDYLQAVGLLQAGMYKEAVGRFNVVLRIHPDLHLAYRGRGLARYHEEQYDLALEDFTLAIEAKPDYAEALRDRGVLLANENRLDEAMRDLEKAVEIYREMGDVSAMSEALYQLRRLQ